MLQGHTQTVSSGRENVENSDSVLNIDMSRYFQTTAQSLFHFLE